MESKELKELAEKVISWVRSYKQGVKLPPMTITVTPELLKLLPTDVKNFLVQKETKL